MGAWTGPGANNQIQQIHVMGSDGTGPIRDTARFTLERKPRQVLGHKRPQSVLHVGRLIAAIGNYGPGCALAEVSARPDACVHTDPSR